ncbi:MAG: hypothetical protein AAGI37_17205 [Planctomycetota bacterium]
MEGRHPYVYLNGTYLKRSWGGEVKNAAILVAIGVAEDAATARCWGSQMARRRTRRRGWACFGTSRSAGWMGRGCS